MKARVTAPMRAALQRLTQGLSLRGHTHGTTQAALRRLGLIEDSDTITAAGRAAIAAPENHA